jgi:hypothetical protein
MPYQGIGLSVLAMLIFDKMIRLESLTAMSLYSLALVVLLSIH